MGLIPQWAPNVHPMLIHFPIVFVLVAAALDLVRLGRPDPGLGRLATACYALGAAAAIVAVLSGRSAEETVYLPGMAHGLVEDHERWAFATAGGLLGASVARLAAAAFGRMERLAWRTCFALVGLVLAFLVHQTAERGARLVYEQGVGVIPGPFPESGEGPPAR